MTEKTLSEKKKQEWVKVGDIPKHLNYYYYEEDVKEAVKRLKNETHGRFSLRIVHDFENFIDQIFGRELTE